MPRIAVIVVAAGSGTRLGGAAPKAFVGIDEHSILRHALRGVFAAPEAQVVVVAPAGREGDALTEALEAAGDRRDLVSIATGGSTRQESVRAGLHAVWADVEIVLVHDAARALTPPEVFARVIGAIDAGADAAIPVLPVIDTIKRVDGDAIVAAVDRAELAAAQTPQGFRRDVLDAAYARGRRRSSRMTRPSSLRRVTTSQRSRATTWRSRSRRPSTSTAPAASSHPIVPASVGISRDPAAPRVGIGTDVHGFGGDGSLWLAGLEWPGEPALSGHSDGDAVAHAIVDALLSAAGLGDIGTHFGTDRPEYAAAHADAFLARTLALLGEAGWRIGNVTVQVQANRPRFAARRVEAEAALSAALGGASVSVSATTTDGLGFTGAGEGVAAFAVALVLPA